jgi:hypothetical protein
MTTRDGFNWEFLSMRAGRVCSCLMMVVLVAVGACANPSESAEGQHSTVSLEAEVTFEGSMASGFMALYEPYAEAARALAADDAASTALAVTYVETAARELGETLDADAAGVAEESLGEVEVVVGTILEISAKLQLVTDLEEMRTGFKRLSDAMILYRDALIGVAPMVAYCPMAQAAWLQTDKVIANPYYGTEMLRCGEIIRE